MRKPARPSRHRTRAPRVVSAPPALAALTGAALALPGLAPRAATPDPHPQAFAHFGYYRESDRRLRAEVWEGGFSAPVGDRWQFAFRTQRDTYSGASPAFSLPATLTARPRYGEQGLVRADVVSAASGGASAQGMTVLGGLNTFVDVAEGMQDTAEDYVAFLTAANAATDAARQADIDAFLLANPSPPFPPTIAGPVTIDFPAMLPGYFGKANQNLGTACPEGLCYLEDGFVLGTVLDPINPTAHLHRTGTVADRALEYHADSGGIYLRAANGEAFNLARLAFSAPLDPADNPGSGPTDFWEILGFDSAVNANLHAGDGTNYGNRVAYQTVANGFDGVLALDAAFRNVNAVWIHYAGQPTVPTDPALSFDLAVDDIELDSAQFAGATPAQQAWLTAFNTFLQTLDQVYAPAYAGTAAQADEQLRQATIEVYRAFLDQAVPTGTPTVQSFQQQPEESRTQPVFEARYYLDDTLLGIDVGLSDEPDFESNYGSLRFEHTFANQSTTLSGSYGYTHNRIRRSTDVHDHDAGHGGHHDDPDHNPTDYAPLDDTSRFHAVELGLAQVVDRHTVVSAGAGYTRQRGYLSNPYKLVYVRGEITAEEYFELAQGTSAGDIDWRAITALEVVGIELFREVRPDERDQVVLSGSLRRHLPRFATSLHADYRYYRDDWDIDAHTLSLALHQPLGDGWLVTPSLRYYTQSSADFFAPYFLAPRADGHYSSDHRLSAYGALSGGVALRRQWQGVRFDAGFEYYTHQGALRLGGDGTDGYADFDAWIVHAGLNIELDEPGGGDVHAAHHDHGAPLPAGVMDRRSLARAGDFMFGYRYQFDLQSGDVRDADGAVDDTAIAALGCGDVPCLSKPGRMAMHMHMLELMYAPTTRLTLMVMPQIMDMTMDMDALTGATEDDAHAGEHTSDGLGDTQLAVLFRLAEGAGQRVHAGLALSAPTGSTGQTLDGSGAPDSERQDYGMQLGSGTWDLLPSVQYEGTRGRLFWGAQVQGTLRLEERNDAGYALGDRLQLSGWSGWHFTPRLAGLVRLAYAASSAIDGAYDGPAADSSPGDFPDNHGGEQFDVGFGVDLALPAGVFGGSRLAAEWLQPVSQAPNGLQLERRGALFVNWHVMLD